MINSAAGSALHVRLNASPAANPRGSNRVLPLLIRPMLLLASRFPGRRGVFIGLFRRSGGYIPPSYFCPLVQKYSTRHDRGSATSACSEHYPHIGELGAGTGGPADATSTRAHSQLSVVISTYSGMPYCCVIFLSWAGASERHYCKSLNNRGNLIIAIIAQKDYML